MPRPGEVQGEPVNAAFALLPPALQTLVAPPGSVRNAAIGQSAKLESMHSGRARLAQFTYPHHPESLGNAAEPAP